jgi:putative heme iron utilization protein
MKISKFEAQKAAGILQENGLYSLAEVLETIAKNPETNTIDLINRDHYFATILWQRQDIYDSLRSWGDFETITEEMVDAVLDHLSIEEMQNCSHGWDVIESTIDDIRDDLDELAKETEREE